MWINCRYYKQEYNFSHRISVTGKVLHSFQGGLLKFRERAVVIRLMGMIK